MAPRARCAPERINQRCNAHALSDRTSWREDRVDEKTQLMVDRAAWHRWPPAGVSAAVVDVIAVRDRGSRGT
jgi:hypothetical protein